MSDAVDLLFAALGATGMGDQDPEELAQLAARLVSYCLSRERSMPRATEADRYPWLATVVDDAAFVARFCEESLPMSPMPSGAIAIDRAGAETEALGFAGAGRRVLLNCARRLRLRRGAVHRVSTPLVSYVRGTVAPGASVFSAGRFWRT